MPGPRSTTRTTSRGPTSRERTSTGWPSPWTTAFSSRLAKARSSWVGSARSGRQVVVERQPHLLAVRRRSIRAPRRAGRQLDRLAVRLGGARFEPRDVEQVLDQPREPLPLVDHRVGELAALVGGDAGRVERGAGGDDRGQRRAQIVGHRRAAARSSARRSGAAPPPRSPLRASGRAPRPAPRPPPAPGRPPRGAAPTRRRAPARARPGCRRRSRRSRRRPGRRCRAGR